MSVLDVDRSRGRARHPGLAARRAASSSTASASSACCSGCRSCGWCCCCFGAVFADLLPLKDPNRTFSRRRPQRAVGRRTGSAPTTSATTCSPARSTAPGARSRSPVDRHGHRHRSSAAPSASSPASTARPLDSDDRGVRSTSCWRSRRSCCCSPSSPFLAPPDEASPTAQTFWVTVVAVDARRSRAIARITRAQTMVWSRPRLRDGVADARGPQQADHVPRDAAQRRAGAVLVRLHARSPC